MSVGGLVWYESAKDVMAVVSCEVNAGVLMSEWSTYTLDTSNALARGDLGHQHLFSHGCDQPPAISGEQDRSAGIQRLQGPW